jgi:hypothetical protein
MQLFPWALEELGKLPLATAEELIVAFEDEVLSPEGVSDYRGLLQSLIDTHKTSSLNFPVAETHRNSLVPGVSDMSRSSGVHLNPIPKVGSPLKLFSNAFVSSLLLLSLS